MRFSAVIFDLDDTISDRGTCIRDYCDMFVLSHFSEFEQGSHSEISNYLFRRYNEDLGKDLSYFADVLSGHKSLSIFTPERLQLHYWKYTIEHLTPKDGALRVILELRTAGVEVAILTNGRIANQRPKLFKLGLEGIVEHIAISDEIGYQKSDRRAYLHVMDRGGFSPEKTIMVGDCPRNDVKGAINAGISAAWVKNGREWAEPDYAPHYQLNSLTEILGIVLDESRTTSA